jgi:C1A family cysteine protease
MYSSTPIIMYYQSGIITGCPQVQIDQMDHAILIVGYNNTDPSNGYLKVKNSWGKGWGEGGYFRIAINGNQCGICYTSVSSF